MYVSLQWGLGGGKRTNESDREKHYYFSTKNFMDLKSTILTLRKRFYKLMIQIRVKRNLETV